MPSAIAAACAVAALASPLADLRFSEMYVMPVGPGGLVASPRLAALDGHPGRIAGYMVWRAEASQGAFLLAPVPVVLGDEDDGYADDLPPSVVAVHLAAGHDSAAVKFRPGIVRVAGILQVGMARESDGRLSPVRLLLDDEASAAFLAGATARAVR